MMNTKCLSLLLVTLKVWNPTVPSNALKEICGVMISELFFPTSFLVSSLSFYLSICTMNTIFYFYIYSQV